MGRSLNGNELGVGIMQRKDGLYTARFTTKTGRRKQAYFKKLQECRNWLAEAKMDEEHGNILSCNPTINAWFEYWISVKSNAIRNSTEYNYRNWYKWYIAPTIGRMLIQEVKPFHVQKILSDMAQNYSASSIQNCRVLLRSLFDCALENDLILKNPITKGVKVKSQKVRPRKMFLTPEEQSKFLEACSGKKFELEFRLILQTGLRTGELLAMTWSDVDYDKGMLYISKSVSYDHTKQKWVLAPPKTQSGTRSIPMTQEARRILKLQERYRKVCKVIPLQLQMQNLVFANDSGYPAPRSTYNAAIRSRCKSAEIPYISMHILRHTFATRCIEAGMRPKTLQLILGHSDVSMTMNLYVHVSENEKIREVAEVENYLRIGVVNGVVDECGQPKRLVN